MQCYRLHRPTSIEITIQNKLRSAGVIFIPEYKIGRWSIDIFVQKHNVAIECDGEYWHRDSERDKRKDKYLKSIGIRVIRLPEKDIRNNPDKCVQSILSIIG